MLLYAVMYSYSDSRRIPYVHTLILLYACIYSYCSMRAYTHAAVCVHILMLLYAVKVWDPYIGGTDQLLICHIFAHYRFAAGNKEQGRTGREALGHTYVVGRRTHM